MLKHFKFICLALTGVAAVIISLNIASGVFGEDKLYPVESLPTINPPVISPAQPQLEANPFVPDLPEIPQIGKPIETPAKLAQKFDARNLEVDLLASKPNIESAKVENCKALLEKTLSALPAELTASLDSMKLFFNKRNPRGLSNSHLIELRCGNLAESEIVSVFVHELGHIVDLGKLKGVSFVPGNFKDGNLKIPIDDPSVEFYKLSWINEKKQKFLAERKDFVSGYAMSDPFEDFAESFNFYVLHGKDFRAIKKESHILARKYDFIKNEVFDGVEFDSERNTKNGKRVWDSTLVKFDLEEFFSRK